MGCQFTIGALSIAIGNWIYHNSLVIGLMTFGLYMILSSTLKHFSKESV